MTLIMDASHHSLIPQSNRAAFDEWVNAALEPHGLDISDCFVTRQDQGGYVFGVFERNIAGRHYVVNGEVAKREILVHCGVPPELGLDADVALWLSVQP